MADRDAVGHIGADHDRIRRLDLMPPIFQRFHAVVEFQPAEGGIDEVALAGIPGDVPLQEAYLMPAPGKGGEQGTEGRGMTIAPRSEEHTSELQSLMRNSYAVFCLKKTTQIQNYTIKTSAYHR